MQFPYTFPFAFHIPPTWRRAYRIEARNADGDLIRQFKEPFAMRTRARINQPVELSFKVPADDPGAAALGGPNEIWLRDRDLNVAGKYTLTEIEDSHDKNGLIYSATASDHLAALGAERVFDYAVTARTVSNILADWIALQLSPWPITLGTVEASIASQTFDFTLEDASILQALRSLEKRLAAPALFWVDTERAIHFALAPNSTTGQNIRLKKNLKSIRRTRLLNQQTTRLYLYGGGQGKARTKLSDAEGHSTDYVEAARTAWKYEKLFTVDSRKVEIESAAAGVANFPVRLEYTDADLAAQALANGDDILFLDAAGDQLAHEIETYSNGAILVWVLFPVLSAIYDTPFSMVFGNAASGPQGTTVDHDTSGKTTAWVGTYNTNNTDAEFYTRGALHGRPGIITRRKKLTSITDPDDLLAAANRILADVSAPPIQYDVQAIALNEITPGNTFDKFSLGQSLTVIDDRLSIVSTQTLVGLSQDLDNPADVGLELGQLQRGLVEMIADTTEKQIESEETSEDVPGEDVILDPDVDQTSLEDILEPGTTKIAPTGVYIPTGRDLAALIDPTTGMVLASQVQMDNAAAPNETLADMQFPESPMIDAAKVQLNEDGPVVVADWQFEDDGTIDGLKIEPGTIPRAQWARILADQTSGGRPKYQIQLLSNPLKTDVGSPIDNAEVADPSATALIVGTEWEVITEPLSVRSPIIQNFVGNGGGGGGGGDFQTGPWQWNQ